MTRVLGIACAGGVAHLTVVDFGAGGDVTGTVTEVGPLRLRPVPSGDQGDGFARTLGEWKSTLTEIRPDCVALLLPETDHRTKRTHSQWSPRCAMETLATLACGQLGVPVDHMPSATVRARLGLGKLDQAVKGAASQGKYWSHRALGLFAARAVAELAAERGWPTHLGPRRYEGGQRDAAEG